MEGPTKHCQKDGRAYKALPERWKSPQSTARKMEEPTKHCQKDGRAYKALPERWKGPQSKHEGATNTGKFIAKETETIRFIND
ncbi:hypothetical protein M8J76_006164 [Diaphorina citri]|nr:hypothetical protein M8J76_006164 [Diaphorina citri]